MRSENKSKQDIRFKNPLKSDYFIKVDSEDLKSFSKSEKFWIIFTLIIVLIAILQGIIFYNQQNPL